MIIRPRSIAIACLASALPCVSQQDIHVVLRGRVIDPGGAPIAGAALSVVDPYELDTASVIANPDVQTGADGRFEIALPVVYPRGASPEKHVSIVSKRRVSYLVSYTRLPREDAPKRRERWIGDFVLERGVTLIGQVRDTERRGLENVWVRCADLFRSARKTLDAQVSASPLAGCRSDARGIFRLRNAPANAVRVAFQKDGYYERFVEPATRSTPLSVALPKSGMIEGRVVDAQGKPLAVSLGIYFEAGPTISPRVRSAADGRFKTSVSHPGRYRIRAQSSSGGMILGLVSPILTGPKSDVVVQPVRKKTAEKTAGGEEAAEPERSVMILRAKSEATGESVTGFEAHVHSGGNNYPQGFLLMHTPRMRRKPGPKGILTPTWGATRGGTILVTADGFAPAQRPFDGMGTEEEPEVLEFKLQPECVIAGTVVDVEGKPIPKARVWSLALGEGAMSIGYDHVPDHAVRTDAKGAFRLPGLVHGRNAIQVWVEGRPPPQAVYRDLAVGQKMADVRVVVPAGQSIQGRFLNTPEAPGWETGWQVRADPPRRTSGQGIASFSRFTSGSAVPIRADGTFSIDGLEASAPHRVFLVRRVPERIDEPLTFELGKFSPSKQVREFDAKEFRPGVLRGTLKPVGMPGILERILVVAVADAEAVADPGHRYARVRDLSRSALPARDGRYEIPVIPGKYRIRVYDVVTCLELAAWEGLVEVPAGESVRTDLPLTPGLVKVSFQQPVEERPGFPVRIKVSRTERIVVHGQFDYRAHMFLRVANIHRGMRLNPGDTGVEFYTREGSYQFESFLRPEFLRDSHSFFLLPAAKTTFDVGDKADGSEVVELNLTIDETPTTAELLGPKIPR